MAWRMDSWRTVTLAEVVTLQRGHDLPSQDREEGQVPIIGSFGITGTHDEAKYQGPGVAIGRSGASIGVATYCKSDYWPLNTCLFVKNFRGNYPRWVYYLLDSIDFTAYNSGSAQPSLNRNYLANIRIALPPLPEQRAIAEVLGALDDKIESNRRKVEILSALEEAQFAKRFSEQPLTLVLADIAEIVDCLHTKKPAKQAQGRTLLQLGNILDDGTLDTTNLHPVSDEDYARWTVNMEATAGDLVITNVGRVGVVARIPNNFRCALGRNMTGVRASQPMDAPFIYRALLDPRTRRGIDLLVDSGTIMDALNVHAIRRIAMPAASRAERSQFADEINSLIALTDTCMSEARSLSKLRNALLPALLSGRIRVPAAAELVEAS